MKILIPCFAFVFAVPAAFAVDYKKDIMPIMKEHCFECHGGSNYKGNLNLDNLGEMSYHIGKFNVIRPGNAKESSFLEKMLLPENARDFMPRKGTKLPDKELELITKWIDEGAVVDAENPTEDEKEWVKKSAASQGGGMGNREFLKWTSNDGKEIEACFLGIQGEAAKLLMKNGKAYTVPFDRLSSDSVAMAKKMASGE